MNKKSKEYYEGYRAGLKQGLEDAKIKEIKELKRKLTTTYK